jgi:predicted NBD/HSP70 family sugar kinase
MGDEAPESSLRDLFDQPDINRWTQTIARACANGSSTVQIVLDRGALGDKRFETRIPLSVTGLERDVCFRYLGAWANNAVMTWGCRDLYVSSPVYRRVKQELDARFPQVERAMQESYGSQRGVHPLDGARPARRAPHSPPAAPVLPLVEASEQPLAGIDIGGTTIKSAVIHRSQLVLKTRTPTFAGPGKTSADLRRAVDGVLARLREVMPPIQALGVSWFGDVRDGKPLMQAQDLVVLMEREGADVVPRWLESLQRGSAVPFTLLSDSEGFGRSLPALCPRPRSYVMVFGTSIGAAYLNQDAEYEDGFSLLGRLVINPLDDARPHASTGVRGVLQRYVASRGILEAIQEISKDAAFAWMHGIDVNRETAGKTLDGWLTSTADGERAAGALVIERLAEALATALEALQLYYEVDEFFFTGTSMEGAVGPAIVESVRDLMMRRYGSRVGVGLAPFDLTYGGAIGAAYIAGLGTRRASLDPR